MRCRLPLAVSLAAALVLAACGDDSSDDGGGTPEASTPADEGAFPVEIEHQHGTTVIDEEPERVVTVGLTDQDAVLALGVTPLGVMEWFGGHPHATWPWAREYLGDAQPEVLGEVELNFERVAALRPDLILAVYSGLTDDEYAQLEQIAPTVTPPGDYNDWGVPWDEQTLTIGRALGRSEHAAELVDEVEGMFDRAVADHPEFEGATAVVATPWEGAISVYGPQDVRGRFLERLGFEHVPEIEDLVGEAFTAELSMEQVELLDVDVIIWILGDDPAGDLADLHDEIELYSRLDVVADGREVAVDNESELGGATSFQTVLSLPVLIDGIVPMLADAVDGDPSTEVDM
jgi:iron complex transport system substrate-binding protein